MASNPNNAIGTNGAFGGRTSVNAFNDVLATFTRGVLSGWGCVPDSGMTVSLGGDGSTRDVAIAEDNAGNKTTINNISGSPVNVTLAGAPANNSRIDVIVAYVDNPPQGDGTTVDNPAPCGIIAVSGTAASTPVAPDENAIRTAITADGASGTTAYYVVLAAVTIASGTTDITAGDITQGGNANPISQMVFDYSLSEVNTGAKWIDGSPIYKKTINFGALPNNTSKYVPHGITNLGLVIKYEAFSYNSVDNIQRPILYGALGSSAGAIILDVHPTDVVIFDDSDRTTLTAYVTIYYTKSA